MATIKRMQNGVRKTANKRRRPRRNTTATTTVAKRSNSRPRRNGTTKAGALSYAKKNGLVLRKAGSVRSAANGVKAVANRRRRKHSRRNGGFVSRTANGIFGSGKSTGQAVLATLGGLAGAKIGGQFATPIVARGLAMIGLQNYASPITIALLSVFAIKPLASKVAGPGAGNAAMVGGLSMAAMSLITQFLPSTNAFNPFAAVNSSPLVLPTSTAQQIVAAGAQAGAAAGAQQAAATLSGVRRMGGYAGNTRLPSWSNRVY